MHFIDALYLMQEDASSVGLRSACPSETMKSPADLRLYLVTDRELSRNRPIEDIVIKAVEGGIPWSS